MIHTHDIRSCHILMQSNYLWLLTSIKQMALHWALEGRTDRLIHVWDFIAEKKSPQFTLEECATLFLTCGSSGLASCWWQTIFPIACVPMHIGVWLQQPLRVLQDHSVQGRIDHCQNHVTAPACPSLESPIWGSPHGHPPELFLHQFHVPQPARRKRRKKNRGLGFVRVY